MQDHAVRQNARRPHSDNGTNAAIRGPRHDGLKQLSATLNSRQRPVVQRVVMVGGAPISLTDEASIAAHIANYANEAAKAHVVKSLKNLKSKKAAENFEDLAALVEKLDFFYNGEMANIGRAARAHAAAASGIPQGENQTTIESMQSPDSMDSWSGGHPELAGAHHRFPKGALGFIHHFMSSTDRQAMNARLNLRPDAGRLALARLGSNLISPYFQGTTLDQRREAEEANEPNKHKALSDRRVDDPHNNRKSAAPDEVALDLMHGADGQRSPRSAVYHRLANQVVPKILEDYRRPRPEGQPYVLPTALATEVTEHFAEAELYHRVIEGDDHATLPSYDKTGAFVKADTDSQAGTPARYKKMVAPEHWGAAFQQAVEAKKRELAEKAASRQTTETSGRQPTAAAAASAAAATASSPAPNAANTAPTDEARKRSRSPKETQMQGRGSGEAPTDTEKNTDSSHDDDD